MPEGTGQKSAGAAASKPTALLTIIGAACTSEKFRTVLFRDPQRVFRIYPDLKLTKDEEAAFHAMVAKRDIPNPVELAFANLHSMLVAIGMPCTWPCLWKRDPIPDEMQDL